MKINQFTENLNSDLSKGMWSISTAGLRWRLMGIDHQEGLGGNGTDFGIYSDYYGKPENFEQEMI